MDPPLSLVQDPRNPPPANGPGLFSNDEENFLFTFFESNIGSNYGADLNLCGVEVDVHTDDWDLPDLPLLLHHETLPPMANAPLETISVSTDEKPLQASVPGSQDMAMLPDGNSGQSNTGPGPPLQPTQSELQPDAIAAARALLSSSGQMFGPMFGPANGVTPQAPHPTGLPQHRGLSGGPAGDVFRLSPNNDPNVVTPQATHPAGPPQHCGLSAGPAGDVFQLSLNNNLPYMFNAFRDPLGVQSCAAPPLRPFIEVQFGSDPNFNGEHFVHESASETARRELAQQLATLQAFRRNPSAAPTRAPSPVSMAPPSPQSHVSMSSIERPAKQQKLAHPLTPDEPEHGEPDRPRKRQRSTTRTTAASPQSSAAYPHATQQLDQQFHYLIQGQGRPITAAASSAGSPSTTTPELGKCESPEAAPPTPEREAAAARRKRRTSSAATNGGKASATRKQPRVNLTEEQKNYNHIQSEQRRRTYIKNHFEALQMIVPTLKSNSFSKAVMLNMTADWLLGLAEENKKLAERVSANCEAAAVKSEAS